MTYVVAYVAVLIVFGMIDAVWLTTMRRYCTGRRSAIF